MNRRGFIALITGVTASALFGLFAIEQKPKLKLSQGLYSMPLSLKIIEEDIGTKALILLKKTSLKPSKFGIVEVQGYMVPCDDWLEYLENS